MARRDRRRDLALARKGHRAGASRMRAVHHTSLRVRHGAPDRKSLLLGTALVSAALLGTLAAPQPAAAQVTCDGDIGTGPDPIIHLGIDDEIDCVNTEARTGEAPDFMAIGLSTINDDHPIFLDSEGTLQSTNLAGDAYGIFTDTQGARSGITIINRGDVGPISATNGRARGLFAYTNAADSPISVINYGDFNVSSGGAADSGATGISAVAAEPRSPVTVTNSGVLTITSENNKAIGIYGRTGGDGNSIGIHNSGDMWVAGYSESTGIFAEATLSGDRSPIDIWNGGNLHVTSDDGNATGILARTYGTDSPVFVKNSGDMWVKTEGEDAEAYGIKALTTGLNSPVTIHNSGDFRVKTRGEDADAYGILAYTTYENGTVSVDNSGDFSVKTRGQDADAYGIRAFATGVNSTVSVHNSGDFRVKTRGVDADAYGIDAFTSATNGTVSVHNSGDFRVKTRGDDADARGIRAFATSQNSTVSVHNSGDFSVKTRGDDADAYGINAFTINGNGQLTIHNSGDMWVKTKGEDADAHGIDAFTLGGNSPLRIHNSGDFWVKTKGEDADAYGIEAFTTDGNSPLRLYNSGDMWVKTKGEDADAYGIKAFTAAGGKSPLELDNSGDMWVTSDGDEAIVRGIRARTYDENSDVVVHNSGDMRVETSGDRSPAEGIDALTGNLDSDVVVHNSGDFWVKTSGDTSFARGIDASARGGGDVAVYNSGDFWVETRNYRSSAEGIEANGLDNVTVRNSGDFRVKTRGDLSGARGIDAGVRASDGAIAVHNSGDMRVETKGFGSYAYGIEAETGAYYNPIAIRTSGDLRVETKGDSSSAYAIKARTTRDPSPIAIHNSGDLRVETAGYGSNADAIKAETYGKNSDIEVWNSGDLTAVTSGGYAGADGIDASSSGAKSDVTIHNSGNLLVETKATGEDGSSADGIDGNTDGENSRLKIVNSGEIRTTTNGDGSADGIDAGTDGDNSAVELRNSGDMWILGRGNDSGQNAGIEVDTGSYDYEYGVTYGKKSSVRIVNSGNLDVTALGDESRAEGIGAETLGDKAKIEIHNSGDLHAEAKGDTDSEAFGIRADVYGKHSPITIHNSGAVFAKGGTRNVGIFAYSEYANKTTIWNTGTIGAESHLAIDVNGAGTAKINNAGIITGFVDLTEQDDVFNNKSGGVFEAKKTSLFGVGDDLFYNFGGGTVQAATVFGSSEKTFFEGLETFKNAGTISMVDGRAGDEFTIANTPGGTDLKYKAMPGATLAVDSFLGGPGSKSDTFTVQGDVSGTTKVAVSNTNTGPGVFNSTGIPVVFVDGATPSAGNFRLQDGPIDTGFFDYDLFFVPTNSGFWELRSFAGGGAHLLPQLLTAAQDIWHQSSATWFDRTADLRVLMQDGPAPADLGGKSLGDQSPAPVQEQLTPAVWLKAGGSWLERDANASTRAYGRNYDFNLDRELETIDVQVGIDFGTRDVFGSGDALVFGVLGGFVHGDLDYDNIARHFQYEGGQVGVYATYLSGGLFVDTLLNAHIYELDANNVAFPGSIDGNTVGLRTDAGYRFGSFSGGVFLEPLGTIEVMWADLDGFALGGNRVSFDDEANVRGRLGLRAGTTTEVWDGTLMEPFVIGSVWGNLSDDNAATLVSTGRTFRFVDDPEDVWGEVSAGVNFFNFTQTTSVFGKVDVQFGDDLTGVSGKSGVRVAW